METPLNYLLERDEMIRDFKFFIGFVECNVLDIETELTRELSAQIANEIDNEIINELTRRINGGQPSVFEGEIQRFRDNVNYFSRWMDIGGQRA